MGLFIKPVQGLSVPIISCDVCAQEVTPDDLKTSSGFYYADTDKAEGEPDCLFFAHNLCIRRLEQEGGHFIGNIPLQALLVYLMRGLGLFPLAFSVENQAVLGMLGDVSPALKDAIVQADALSVL